MTVADMRRQHALDQAADPTGYRAARQRGMGATPMVRTERARLAQQIGVEVRWANARRLEGRPAEAAAHTRKANRLRQQLRDFDEAARAATAPREGGTA